MTPERLAEIRRTWAALEHTVAGGHVRELSEALAVLERRLAAKDGVLLRALTSLYIFMPIPVAKLCDEELDTSGALLGRVRERAREALRAEPAKGEA